MSSDLRGGLCRDSVKFYPGSFAALSRLTSTLLPSLAGEPDVRRPRGRDPREATARRQVLGDDGLPADVRARRLTGSSLCLKSGISAEFGLNIVLRYLEGRSHGGPLVVRSTVMGVLL